MIETPIKEQVFCEKSFINFLTAQGIEVKTTTKARGNLGICMKNRIDISKNAAKEKRIAILAHEYAHKIHLDIEKDSISKGGSLEKLFKLEKTDVIARELVRVTHFVDNNSLFIPFHNRKREISGEIKCQEAIIRQVYPDFKRSQAFKPVIDYFKKHKSNAKYLLRYDNIKIVHPITRREELILIKNLDTEFSDIPLTIRAYIKILSLQREQARMSRRKNKAEKYYLKPTELFARFVQGLFTDGETIKNIAPTTYERFEFLLGTGYYGNLRELLDRAGVV